MDCIFWGGRNIPVEQFEKELNKEGIVDSNILIKKEVDKTAQKN